MNTNSNILHDFNEKHHAWEKTKQHAIDCLDNYSIDDKKNGTNELKGLTSKDFSFIRKNQEFIFWNEASNVFYLRTTFELVIKNHNNHSSAFGLYSLDLDSADEIIDDWLIIF